MVSKIEVKEEVISQIKGGIGRLEKLAQMHSKLRMDFLVAEGTILKEIEDQKQKVLVTMREAAISHGIEESELQSWSLDVDEGIFVKQ